VLRRVAGWFGGGGGAGGGGGGGGGGGAAGGGVSVSQSGGAPACVLVHGVFGSGKSTLLVAVLWFLQRLLHGRRAARPGLGGR